MPKLIVKQNVGAASNHAGQHQWLSFGGLALLLVGVAATAYFFTRPVITSPAQEPLALDSAQDQHIKANYLSMHTVFNELSAEYEQLSAQGPDDYQKNIKLLGKSEGILAHLDKMHLLAGQLSLSDDEYKRLANRHQFNKDYWQAKLHFRELRVSRFGGGELINTREAVAAGTTVQEVKLGGVEEKLPVAESPKKFKFAKPPPGMKLPAGFCDLSNPASCKPEEDATIAAEDVLPLPENIAEQGGTESPKKFKFAKPPPGMKLPAGFCDLSNPASCKPEEDATIAVDENNNPDSNAN